MRILVTGGAGFVGANLIKKLSKVWFAKEKCRGLKRTLMKKRSFFRKFAIKFLWPCKEERPIYIILALYPQSAFPHGQA